MILGLFMALTVVMQERRCSCWHEFGEQRSISFLSTRITPPWCLVPEKVPFYRPGTCFKVTCVVLYSSPFASIQRSICVYSVCAHNRAIYISLLGKLLQKQRILPMIATPAGHFDHVHWPDVESVGFPLWTWTGTCGSMFPRCIWEVPSLHGCRLSMNPCKILGGSSVWIIEA